MRYFLSALAIVLTVSACGGSEELVVLGDPDVFTAAGVDSYSTTTAFQYSFQNPETAGDLGTIYNAAHLAEPRRTRVNLEITSLGNTNSGELYFLEDGTVLSRPGQGPFVPLDSGPSSIDDVTWLGDVHRAVAPAAADYEFVGDETISGVAVQHFEGPVVFPERLIARDIAAGLGLTVEFEGKSDVWVDPATGLIMAFEVEASADQEIAFLTVTAAVRINDLGGAVVIERPDESLIIPSDILADDRAKTALNDVLLATQLYHTGDESYTGLSTGALQAREPSVGYVEGPIVTSPGVVGFIAEEQRVMLVTVSETGTWFCVAEDRRELTPVVTFGGGDSNDVADSFEDCSNPVWPPSLG